MMDLDSAIQHCKEQVQEQAKKGCYSCAEEHQQLAEWLKELKEYREQSGDAISRQAVAKILLKYAHTMEGKAFAEFLISQINNLPSVTPQQRTGRWERMSDLPNDVDDRFKCSRCGNIVHYNNVMNLRTFSRWCGRCGSYND